MNNSEIQIQFPRPGQWDEFILTAIYRDAGGYRPPARFNQDDIPVEQAPAMQAVVAALVGLSEPWQAVQVWARLGITLTYDVANDRSEYVFAVVLTVEAVNPQGGRRVFTSRDYPEFTITDPAAVAFFNFFTTVNE
ncbi:MAG: ABC transporter substrate-binding protein [Akkermansia muciniphila]|nr:ABC transporter substrate-binding protein [Akkermansia muciniphila]